MNIDKVLDELLLSMFEAVTTTPEERANPRQLIERASASSLIWNFINSPKYKSKYSFVDFDSLVNEVVKSKMADYFIELEQEREEFERDWL